MKLPYLLSTFVIATAMLFASHHPEFAQNSNDKTNNTAQTQTDKKEQVRVEPKPVDEKQLQCLAENIYHEARGESVEGKAAVARVVMNRVRHGFAPTPCKVIYTSNTVEKVLDEETGFSEFVKVCQFSWVCEDPKTPSKSDPLYRQALYIAHEVLAVDAYADVVPKSALFFHNTTVSPSWPYTKLVQIGNHIFYSRTKKKTQTQQNTKKTTQQVAAR
jgi:spore germination cell wall hydrolase CwlJ-like protein